VPLTLAVCILFQRAVMLSKNGTAHFGADGNFAAGGAIWSGGRGAILRSGARSHWSVLYLSLGCMRLLGRGNGLLR